MAMQSVISEYGSSRDMNPVYLARIENRQKEGLVHKWH